MRIYNPDLEKTGVLFGIDTSMGGENSDYCGVTIRART